MVIKSILPSIDAVNLTPPSNIWAEISFVHLSANKAEGVQRGSKRPDWKPKKKFTPLGYAVDVP